MWLLPYLPALHQKQMNNAACGFRCRAGPARCRHGSRRRNRRFVPRALRNQAREGGSEQGTVPGARLRRRGLFIRRYVRASSSEGQRAER